MPYPRRPASSACRASSAGRGFHATVYTELPATQASKIFVNKFATFSYHHFFIQAPCYTEIEVSIARFFILKRSICLEWCLRSIGFAFKGDTRQLLVKHCRSDIVYVTRHEPRSCLRSQGSSNGLMFHFI